MLYLCSWTKVDVVKIQPAKILCNSSRAAKVPESLGKDIMCPFEGEGKLWLSKKAWNRRTYW